MKKSILFISVLVALFSINRNANAQITLEHTYPGAFGHLYIVNLENYGQKYCWRDWATNYVRLYNLDHSVFRAMPLPVVSYSPLSQRFILYISQNLFSCINNYIEYMYIYVDSTMGYSTRIVNELGNVFLAADSFAPLVIGSVPQQQVPIYNTPLGTKMILSGGSNSDARVYDLCGTLSTSIQPTGLSEDQIASLSVFPNPSSEHAMIEYSLPQGISSGEIILYDMNGTEIKRYRVDSTFNNILLDNSGLHSGTYFYQLTFGGNIIGAKRMVIIK
jgi:hypothetical protein